MKFSAREDIGLPIAEAFAALSDVDRFQRAALRRGAEVQRRDTLQAPGIGMMWTVRFNWRGGERQLDLHMGDFSPPDSLGVDIDARSVEGRFHVGLMALSRARTRVSVQFEIRPRTLPARLLIQSLRLTKNRLNTRFKQRVTDFAKDIEDRNAGVP